MSEAILNVLGSLVTVILVGQAPDTVLDVTPPPPALNADPFYKKHVSAGGLPIMSSEKVSDAALREAGHLIGKMVRHRPEVLKAMIAAGVRIVVMHPNEMTTDIPEQRHMKPKRFWDLRARGLGGRITSCGEENLLNLPGDRYPTENILIHEFAHCMHGGLGRIDPDFNRRLTNAYEKARAKGLWKGTYAGTSRGEYWAEGVQSWFDTNRQNDSLHNHVDTREELKVYDPDLATLLTAIYGDDEWRYQRYDVRTKGRASVFRFSRFYADREYGGDGKPGFVRAGDMDGDGDLDLVAGGGRALFVYAAGGRVAEWKRFGNLDGTGAIGANGAVLHDVDRDGDLDVVAAKYRSDLGWWENPGPPLREATWAFHGLAASELYLHDLIRADLDGDGKAEEFIAALLGGRDGANRITVVWFKPPAVTASPKRPWPSQIVDAGRPEGEWRGHAGLDVGDIDRDEHVDIAFSNGWYEAPNGPTGKWSWHPVAPIRGVSNTKLRDLDGDGDLDLIVAAGHHGKGIFWFACPREPATGQWEEHTVDASIVHPEGLDVVDLDGDGDLELVACDLDFDRWDREVHHVYVYENRGTTRSPVWEEQDVSGDSFACHQLQVVDLDGDGRLDIIGEGCGYGVISYYQNGSPE